ncbi:nucleotidyltransferase domain-containing protein [Paenibacillus sp. FSL K6-0276]|uniref:nucleotidyltransferase domain-containing protein n=1 Tax=Paenibacillus sp. FSL K6-0276 TaxID=2921450 RepID=UPI0030EBA046
MRVDLIKDLSFIKSQVHHNLLADILQKAISDEEISGVMLCGSFARGDANEGSDLDIYIVLKNDYNRSFYAETKHGILIEIKYANVEKAREKLRLNSMEVYNYIDGNILYDSEGLLEGLSNYAMECFHDYKSKPKDKRETSHWLKSSKIKIQAAFQAGDVLKASFVVSTSSYKILEAFWLINNMPMPPNGGVLTHLKDLKVGSSYLEKWKEDLFLGSNEVRISTALEMIDFVTPFLEQED